MDNVLSVRVIVRPVKVGLFELICGFSVINSIINQYAGTNS